MWRADVLRHNPLRFCRDARAKPLARGFYRGEVGIFIRLLQAQILATARNLDIRAETLGIKVSPLPRIELEPERTRTLSPAAAAHLRAAAAAASDPEWQDLFGRLAALAKPSR